MPVFLGKNMRLMYGQKHSFFKNESWSRPFFSINENHPVGHSDLSKETYEKWSSYSKAVNLLHNFLNLMKQDVATGCQWKNCC